MRDNNNINALLRDAELQRGGAGRALLLPAARRLHGHPRLAARLAREATLKRHASCVNRVSFSACGALLASASDDTRVVLWDVDARRERRAVLTEHSENIFGVRFMPHSGNALVATGAMDFEVRVTNVERGDSRLFDCHANRVKTVDVDNSSPHMLWSSSEDATVREFDLREPLLSNPGRRSASNVLLHLVSGDGDPRSGAAGSTTPPFSALPHWEPNYIGLKSAQINQADPRYIIVAGDVVRIFDRRFLSRTTSSPAGAGSAVEVLCPAHLRPDAPERSPCARGGVELFATYAAFSECGTRAVASFFGDHVYVFDVGRSGASASSGTEESSARAMQRRGLGKGAAILQGLLTSALGLMEQCCDSTAISVLNEALALAPDNVVALHARCEALIRRAWVSDYRDALACSEKLRGIVARDSSALDELVSATIASRSPASSASKSPSASEASHPLDESRRAMWSALLGLQRAAAALGVVIPRGRLHRATCPRAWRGMRRQSRESLVTLGRLDDLSDLLHDVLQQLDVLFNSMPQLRHLADVGEAALVLFPLDGSRKFYKVCLTRLLTARLWETIESLDHAFRVLKRSRRRDRRRNGESSSSRLMRSVVAAAAQVAKEAAGEETVRSTAEGSVRRSDADPASTSPTSRGQSSNVHDDGAGPSAEEEAELSHAEYDHYGEGLCDNFDSPQCCEVDEREYSFYGAEDDEGEEGQEDEDVEEDEEDEEDETEEEDEEEEEVLEEEDAENEVDEGDDSRRDSRVTSAVDKEANVRQPSMRISDLVRRVSKLTSKRPRSDASKSAPCPSMKYCGRDPRPRFWGKSIELGYEGRYVGHRNIATDIKEANFYGSTGQCVMSGSDDGYLHVWSTRTGRLVARLHADADVVNCVQAAPHGYGGGLVASSGIDSDVKLWAPSGDDRDLDADAEEFESNFLENGSNVDFENPSWRLGFNPFDGLSLEASAFNQNIMTVGGIYHDSDGDGARSGVADCRVS